MLHKRSSRYKLTRIYFIFCKYIKVKREITRAQKLRLIPILPTCFKCKFHLVFVNYLR